MLAQTFSFLLTILKSCVRPFLWAADSFPNLSLPGSRTVQNCSTPCECSKGLPCQSCNLGRKFLRTRLQPGFWSRSTAQGAHLAENKSNVRVLEVNVGWAFLIWNSQLETFSVLAGYIKRKILKHEILLHVQNY